MRLETRIRSAVMGFMASQARQDLLCWTARTRRKFASQKACLHYFHQVDDPYSHLAVQKLQRLAQAYDLEIEIHLVSAPANEYQGNSARFKHWAINDAKSVARHYGVNLASNAELPKPGLVNLANNRLAGMKSLETFVAAAIEVGEALWADEVTAETGEQTLGDAAIQRLALGDARRDQLGHYLSAMFYFEGEWFWGLDRLYLLERRLIAEGFGSGPVCVPRPQVAINENIQAKDISLQYFPSLRSPYTALGHQRVMDLVKRTGVNLVMSPVMPMMMRGVPAPRRKQLYIISDAGREARAAGVKFGNFVDPFGEPVKRAFALYPWIERQGKAHEFVAAYLEAAWADGVDIVSEAGLKQVVESIGLDWSAAKASAENDEWQDLLDNNVQTLLNENLWGVPSFRVFGGKVAEGEPETYACWGQDRIWRVEAEIISRASATP